MSRKLYYCRQEGNIDVCLRDDRALAICTINLKFESRRASLVRVWDNRDFTLSSEPIRYVF